jgi:hypothetical protein
MYQLVVDGAAPLEETLNGSIFMGFVCIYMPGGTMQLQESVFDVQSKRQQI